ncbi:hypothetical protein [Flagellimonas zhangzhouensis]|uniref:Uncharacterized protein n=1 Tax=Flagellimonas zhangzhouensis TaxID=1073328 RepID=A0A1H2VGD2_9FLAO|nr:hypothetical protein [Allomuricauda zhangzhouensis]SDQ08311.1 hypothetical protein SAMN05216294_0240 [Allomuricauda zhangzhouensis]SDW66929.1 hypothetical protein SAMN04487892_2053 [Allomuricauda zhangzhouensis]
MELICQSKYYTFYQAEKERRFYIDFGQKTIPLNLCQLIALRHKVLSISIEDHFDSDLNKHGFEVLLLCNKEHLFVLNTLEILDLKELVQHSFCVMGIAATRQTASV